MGAVVGAVPGGQTARMLSAYRALLQHRGDGSVCPSEVARIVGGEDWRQLLPAARATAFASATTGENEIRQRGQAVAKLDWDQIRGPIRVGRRPAHSTESLPE